MRKTWALLVLLGVVLALAPAAWPDCPLGRDLGCENKPEDQCWWVDCPSKPDWVCKWYSGDSVCCCEDWPETALEYVANGIEVTSVASASAEEFDLRSACAVR